MPNVAGAYALPLGENESTVGTTGASETYSAPAKPAISRLRYSPSLPSVFASTSCTVKSPHGVR